MAYRGKYPTRIKWVSCQHGVAKMATNDGKLWRLRAIDASVMGVLPKLGAEIGTEPAATHVGNEWRPK